ncbi:MAG: patatin-like phospholipase family protein [Candidatus Anstonellales archaeon]
MRYIKLSLSGGGVKCIAHIGLIRYLIEKEYIPIQLCGVSGGAIISGLYSYFISKGLDPYSAYKSILDLISKIDISSFKDISILSVLSIPFTDGKNFGFVKGKKIHDFLLSTTERMKFKDLKIDLYITATEFTTGRLVVFSNYTTPEVLLADAIRSSISIQGIFKPFKIKPDLVRNSIFETNSIYSNIIDDHTFSRISSEGYIYLIDGGNLGNCRNDILLDSVNSLPVIGCSLSYENDYRPNVSIIGIFNHTIDIMINSMEDFIDRFSDRDITIKPSVNVGTTDFNIGKDKILEIIDSTYEYVKSKDEIITLFIEGRN